METRFHASSAVSDSPYLTRTPNGPCEGRAETSRVPPSVQGDGPRRAKSVIALPEHEPTHYTDRFRRLATAAAIASLLSYAAVLFVTPSALNKIQKFYGVPLSRLGLFSFALLSGFFVAVLTAGTYSDKHGKLPAIFAGCTAMAAGVAIFTFTRSFPIAVLAHILMGIGGGLSEGTAMALVSDLYHGRRKTSMMNISQAAFGLGAVGSPALMALLIGLHVDWYFGYAATAGLCVVSAIVAIAALSMKQERPHREHYVPGAWRSFIADRRVLLWAGGIMLYVGAELGQSNWMAVYLRQSLATSEAMAAAGLSLMWIGITVGRTSIAWAARHLSEPAIVRISLAGAALSQTSLLLVGDPQLALASAFLLGVFLGPFFPTITSIAGEAFPRQSGVVLGIIVASGSAGAAIFTPTIGLIADHLGIRGALWTCSALLAVNLTLFLTIGRAGRRRAT